MSSASKYIIVEDDVSKKNLEIGSGCGGFGMKFYPNCYLTDIAHEFLDKTDCEWIIDVSCSANNLPWSDNRFEKIIIANPYRFGFSSAEEATELLKELSRVIRDGGEIIVIGSHSNKYVAKIDYLLNKKVTIADVKLQCKTEIIEPSLVYNDHVFRNTNNDIVIPNLRFTIHVSKH